MSLKSKDAKKAKEYDISTYTKGITSTYTINGIVTNEFFQFKEISQIIHYPNIGVEIINYNGSRRVFYNDIPGQSQALFDSFNTKMNSWMTSNLN